MAPEHVAILARHAREATFETDQVVFRQGENAHQFYLLLKGAVALETYVARADSIPLQTVNAGDVFGWSWLFSPFVWHWQARALEPTRAIFLDGARLLVACEQDPAFGFQLMKRLAQVVVKRLETAQKRLCEIQQAEPPLPLSEEPKRPRSVRPAVAQSLEEMLAEHPFFHELKPKHLGILAGVAMPATFETGDVIFQAGEPANRFYLIQRGQVGLETLETEPTSSRFQIIGAGDVLGWSWMFPPFQSHFAARALEPTQSIFLYGTRLREVCEQDAELGYALMKRTVAVVIQRLQATRERLLEITTRKNAKAIKAELLAGKGKPGRRAIP